MKSKIVRICSLMCSVILLLTCLPMTAFAAYENTHTNTGDQAADIVAVAKTQIGYHEGSLAGTSSGSNNYTKYGVWYDNYTNQSGFSYGAWCAMFVSWCAYQADIPSSTVYYHAYCPYGVTWWKNQGLWQNSAYYGGSYTPKAGDIIYFGSGGTAGHIGIVTGASGGYVYTVEGNTSSATYDPEGNVCADKSYALSNSRIMGYGTPNYEEGSGTTAEKLGTYTITASSLNVRAGASSDYDIVGELLNGDIVEVTELSNGWGKVTLSDGTVGWCAIGDYGDYIGVDALNTNITAAWGADSLSMTVNQNGSVTFTNTSATEAIAVDLPLVNAIGNKTTPYLNVSVKRNSGSWYFGLTKANSGYFMMRECTSGDELVNATSATYMVTDETLQIDIGYWWAPEDKAQIDDVRLYLNTESSITVNYCYFAEEASVVTSDAYNLRKNTAAAIADPENLLTPDTLTVTDRTKSGGYSYWNGILTVMSNDASGYDVSMTVNKTFKPEEFSRWLISVDATTSFDIELVVTTSDGDRTFSLRDDFYTAFCETPDGDYIPAFIGSAGLDFLGCYTYNGVLPTDGYSTVKAVNFRLGGVGTLTVNACQLAENDALKIFTDTVQVSDSTPDTVTIKGDVNGDGLVSTTDSRLILTSLLVDADLDLSCADYNGDGLVTTTDARLLLQSFLV